LRKQLAHRSRWIAPLAAFALLLSGCFRPAGDSIPPTSAATIDLAGQPASNPSATTAATAETPAVTLLSPDASGATATPIVPAITEVTVIPFEASATPTPVEGTLTATLQLITPGSALNLVTPDTPTPLPTEQITPIGASITVQGTLVPSDIGTLSAGGTGELVSGADCTYTVRAGDSLYAIALRNDTTVDDLKAANSDLEGDDPVLQIDQVLAIPNCIPGQPRPTSAPQLADDSTAVPVAAATQDVYTVKPGDTLYGIATRYGVTINAIMRANSLANPNTLSIGQKLVIPAKAQ
jgi:LysM repeat protein